MTPSYQSLVLNADFTPMTIHPLSVWDFARTMRNVMKGRVIVLEEYDKVFRSPTTEYVPPSVVALKDYVKRPDRVPFTRKNVFLRDDFRCQYCGDKFPTELLTFDHVVPRSMGGGTNFENICTACMPCNSRKGSRTDMRPMRMPYRPNSRELMHKKPLGLERLETSWLDYLYWSGVIESD